MERLRTISIALCAVALAACAAKKSAPPPQPAPSARATAPAQGPRSGKVEDTVTATATVVAINHKTRHVTLKRPDGTKFTIVAGPEVRNLAQVKKGDVLRITYYESIAYQVQEAGHAQPGAGASTDVSRAPLGAKPGGKVTDTVSVRATIEAIDKPMSEVSLRGPHGRVTVVKVKDPAKLDAVHVGEVVDITYTEALAVVVEEAGSK